MSTRILMIGSGSYIKEWIANNRDKIAEYDRVYALNSAAYACDFPFYWVASLDYFHVNKNFNSTEFMEKIRPHCLNCPKSAGGIAKVKTVKGPITPKFRVAAIFIDALYHLINMFNSDVEIDCIGCDLDYSEKKTHFYGVGGRDPIRFSTSTLLNELGRIQGLIKLRNISGNPKALWGVTPEK